MYLFVPAMAMYKCLAVNKGPITQDNTEKNLDYSSAIYCLFRPIFGYSCLDTLIYPLNQCIDFTYLSIYRVKQKICGDLYAQGDTNSYKSDSSHINRPHLAN